MKSDMNINMNINSDMNIHMSINNANQPTQIVI